MKDKIKLFFQNEKVKKFGRRIFNKKTVIAALVAIVIVIALRVAFSLLFQVEGTVTNVDGSKVTVANFITTKTVDIGNFQTTSNSIQVGDRVEIMKNLSGDIISVRDRNNRNLKEKRNRINKGGKSVKGNGQRNSMQGK
ncbi:hypothetical protein [Clostridium folliculivorans]|uniref:Uncharacterized protein n=1 Tax=Clostridium folliculivorans TaxID=2886038 RepID=A0A9W5Y122_9CLOT|nr:hypothetical protein [Clostridium folliculivorans]GKU24590.1 hypothetical protein CFOLD11_14160 [Clostridium folliculivorans]GKU30688.1 hypothetical protein CFB3_27950 [Clostridium folliculivorans]